MRRRSLIWMLLLLAAAGTGVATWAAVTGQTGWFSGVATSADSGPTALEALGRYGEVPDFRLTERSGRTVTRAELLGKVWVASFIYTQCTETCPLQTARLARLQTEFAGEAGLRLVSITVDPERDTVPALSSYAEKYGADPRRWLFLTGDKAAIYRLAKEGFRLGVVDPGDPAPARTSSLFRFLSPPPAWATHGSKGLIMHSSRLVLVDRQATIRAYHLPDDEPSLDRLRRNVRAVLQERSTGVTRP